MSDNTGIQWTDATWNCIRGCSAVSPGCANCYAAGVAARFSGKGLPFEGLAKRSPGGKPQWTGEVRMIPEKLDQPLRWKRGRRIFVNSVSDLFHEELTNEQIAAIFGVMAAAPQHTFQVLTKRPERMLEWFRWVSAARMNEDCQCVIYARRHGVYGGYPVADPSGGLLPYRWPLPNVHLGVSCEDQAAADERIPLLLECPAEVRWVSAEPLLAPIDFRKAWMGWDSRPTYEGLRWVVVGGESGPGARPCDIEWIRGILRQCREAGVPAFCKQLGARPYEKRPAEGDYQGTDEALQNLDRAHAQRRWFREGWTIVHTPDGRATWVRHHDLEDSKGGTLDEWPEDLRVRELP